MIKLFARELLWMEERTMEMQEGKMKEAAEIVQSFVRLNKMLTAFTQQNASSLGLTLVQMGVLNTIASVPGQTLKDVTEKLLLPKSSVSIAVDDLVNGALAERGVSAQDRREIHLSATASGMELAQKSARNASSYRAMAYALESLPAHDVQSLLRIHAALYTLLSQYKQ